MKSQSLAIKTTLFCMVSISLTDASWMWFCETDDPCHAANTTAPYQPELRAKNCPFNNNPYCDRFITPGWYRFKNDMLNHPPGLFSCGAVYPSWLNGTLPTRQNEEVERSVCKVGFNNTCLKRVTIRIKHCGSFNAYCLPSLGACSERYCFGEEDSSCEQIIPFWMVTENERKLSTTPPRKPSSGENNKLLSEFCSSDPCKTNNLPKFPYAENRGVNCTYKHLMQPCDRTLLPGWYKADVGESKLLNKCPGVLSCGAIYPVWMEGIHPRVNEGIVKRKICIAGPELGFSKSCCQENDYIYVRNCGRHIAYCLKPLNKCEERYCLDNNAPCTDHATGDKSNESFLLYDSQSQLSVIVTALVMITLLVSASALIIVAFKKRQNVRRPWQKEDIYIQSKKLVNLIDNYESPENRYTYLKIPEHVVSKEERQSDFNVYCMINDVQ